MPRTIPGPAVGPSEFIPDVNLRGNWNNREQPEPITIFINGPTEATLRVISLEYSKKTMGELINHLVCTFVEAVVNYVGRNGPILTGADLIEHGEYDVLHEVGMWILGATVEEKKT